MPPIETRYNGYRFRSRLEARWAVFFESLGLDWEYEKQGYSIGKWSYLPDFWLNDHPCWIEIKPSSYELSERQKYQGLSDETNSVVIVVVGNPYPGKYYARYFMPNLTVQHKEVFEDNFDIPVVFALARRSIGMELCLVGAGEAIEDMNTTVNLSKTLTDDGERYPLKETDKLTQAYERAMSARFEHGELVDS